MSRAQVGDRVVAIRNSDGKTVYIYGRGVYLGRQPVPGWNPDGPSVDGSTWRTDAEEVVRAQMATPQVEWIYDGKPMGVDNWGNPMGDTRTFEQRVDAWLDSIAGNPCIELDGGGRAFGYFCWWTTEAAFETRFVGEKVVQVPLPDPLPHAPQATSEPGVT